MVERQVIQLKNPLYNRYRDGYRIANMHKLLRLATILSVCKAGFTETIRSCSFLQLLESQIQ